MDRQYSNAEDVAADGAQRVEVSSELAKDYNAMECPGRSAVEVLEDRAWIVKEVDDGQ